MNIMSIFNQFVEAVNNHDLYTMELIISPDHIFIDSIGNKIINRRSVLDAWEVYFRLFPDYSISIIETYLNYSYLAAFGYASGTFGIQYEHHSSNHFYLPAAWRTIIEKECIKYWQVYADTRIPYDILFNNQHPKK